MIEYKIIKNKKTLLISDKNSEINYYYRIEDKVHKEIDCHGKFDTVECVSTIEKLRSSNKLKIYCC